MQAPSTDLLFLGLQDPRLWGPCLAAFFGGFLGKAVTHATLKRVVTEALTDVIDPIAADLRSYRARLDVLERWRVEIGNRMKG
jgi:hypothetical protein